MINITHLCQHPVQVNTLNQQPGEHTQPEVVKPNGYKLTWELLGKGNKGY